MAATLCADCASGKFDMPITIVTQSLAGERREGAWRFFFAFFAVEVLSPLIIDPRGRVFCVFVVRAGRRYSRDLGNPVLSKKIIRIAVFFRKLSYFRIVQRRQPAILNDRIVLTAFGVNRERREQEMNVQMTVENSIFSRPFFLFGAPECTEAHVDHTGAAALPLKTSGRMEFDMTRPEDLRIGADGDFP